MALFCSSVPVNYDSVNMSQHAQYQDPETKAAKCNLAIIHFIIYCDKMSFMEKVYHPLFTLAVNSHYI